MIKSFQEFLILEGHKKKSKKIDALYDPDYDCYGIVIFNTKKELSEYKGYGATGKDIITGKKFKKKWLEFEDKKLRKVIYTKNLNIGSNLGEGQYWCVTQDCLDTYLGNTSDSRVYRRWVKEVVELDIDDDMNILVKEGIVDEMRF